MQNIKDAQVELINKFKDYLVKFDKNFFKPEKNSLFYPATYSECIGSYILRKKHHEKKIEIAAHFASKQALSKIEKAGGKISIVKK